MSANNHQSESIKEEIRRLEKRAANPHTDRLEAHSEIMANSKLDLWDNTISREDPPDTIAPDMCIPESYYEEESDKPDKPS